MYKIHDKMCFVHVLMVVICLISKSIYITHGSHLDLVTIEG